MDNAGRSQRAAERRTLDGIRLLSSLEPAIRRALEDKCAWRRYRLGERICERGTEGREVLFVVEGAVNIVGFSAVGSELMFAAAGPGETIGELAAIDGQPRSASVVAAEDSLLAALPSEAFVELLKRHGEVAFRLLQRLAGIVRKSDDRIVEISSVKSGNRVYAELLRLAEPDPAAPGVWAIKPLPPLRELASRSGTTRELVASALSRLYPTGLARRMGANLYITNRAAVEDIVRAAGQAEGM
jgi:CRP/FNR family transcriptional regulator, cyclic AMP receptor protein